jgi:hypothetical protein
VHRALDVLAQLILQRHQDVAEMRELLGIHVFLALFGVIGRKLFFVQQIFGHCRLPVTSEKRLYKRNGGESQDCWGVRLENPSLKG